MNIANEYMYYDLNSEIEKYKKINEENKIQLETVNRYNKHQIREDFKELVMKNLHISELEVNDLEVGVFNATIDYANNAYTALQRRVSSQVGIYRNGTEISSPITYSSNTLHTAYYDGTNEYVYTNGGTVYTNASSGNFSISAYMIGANLGYSSDNQPWNGYIGEVIVYNIALSAPQRQQVEGYLAQKWGLTSSLPVGHSGLTTTLYRADYTKQNIMRAIPYYAAFSPRQISGCALWLDGADPAGNGVVPAQDAQIGTWVDKSGNSRSMTVQGNGAYITYKKVNGINQNLKFLKVH